MSGRAHTWIACSALVAVGLLGLVAECRALYRRHQAQVAATADAEVAARVETARAHLQRREWDEAARLLEEALAVPDATATEEARQLLLQARRGQADLLLDGARAAAGARDVRRALDLLAAYLAHPQAADRESAARLEAAISQALSDPEAIHYLAGLSDEVLARLAQGDVPQDAADPAVRDLFADTLRPHLPQELARRAQLRAARARREEQLRQSPAFRELARFVRAELRDRQAREELAHKQARALALLPAQLKLTDPAELERLRTGGEREETQARVARKRDEARRAFRGEPGHDAADSEAFDRLVDQELAALSRP
jgi:hypothetical protein